MENIPEKMKSSEGDKDKRYEVNLFRAKICQFRFFDIENVLGNVSSLYKF